MEPFPAQLPLYLFSLRMNDVIRTTSIIGEQSWGFITYTYTSNLIK